MKDVISELLQRKEQQEEDVYFESLNRKVIEKLHRQAVTGDRSGTGPPRRVVRPSIHQPDSGRKRQARPEIRQAGMSLPRD